MALQFKVTDGEQTTIYEGFSPSIWADTQFVAIVFSEGETYSYGIEDPQRVSSLVQYLCDHDPNAKMLGLFKRIK